MPDPFENFVSLEGFGDTNQPFIPLDSFTPKQSFTPLTSFESILEKTFRFQQQEEGLRLYGTRGTPVRPEGLLEQFARGLVREATLGLSKFAIKEKQPENVGEDVARAVGSFIGFIGLPITIGGKVASFAVRGVGKLIAKKGIRHVAQYATRGVVTLGVAEVVSDISNVSEAPERFVSGATIGAIFGATHGLHIKNNALLSNIARQFMGRALLGVAGRYDENTLKKENIGNLVFSELLNTFFFSRGITKEQILSGDIAPKKWRDVDAVQKAIDSINAKIPRPFMTAKEIEKLPSVARAIARLDNDKFTVKAIHDVENITDIRYEMGKGIMTPFIESKARPIFKDLVVANIGMDGKNYYGKPGELHINLDQQYSTKIRNKMNLKPGESTWKKVGFAKPGGRVLDRKEAAKLVGIKLNKLDALDYFELPETKANDLWFKRNPKTGELILKYRGAAVEGDKEAIRNIASVVETEVGKIVRFPTMQLERTDAGRKILDWTHESLRARPDIPFRTTSTFLKMFPEIPIDKQGKPQPRWSDLQRMQDILKQVEDAPNGYAPAILGELILQTSPEPLRPKEWNKPGFKELYDKEVGYQNAKNYQTTKKLWAEIDSGKKSGSPLIHLLTPRWAKPLLDLRKIIQHFQRTTGIPFWTIGKKVMDGTGFKNRVVHQILTPFRKFGFLQETEGKNIGNYYDARDVMWKKYQKEKVPEKQFSEDAVQLKKGLTERERRFAGIIDSVMEEIAPDIKLSRFKNWAAAKEENILHPERKIPPIFQEQRKLEPVLEELYRNYKKQGAELPIKERNIAQERWLAEELKKHNFGIIQAGNYLPGMISGRFELKEAGVTNDFITAISDMGKGHFKIRGLEKEEMSRRQMEEVIIQEHFHKELPARIDAYVRHVYNDKFLRQPMKELQKLIDIYRVHLEQTQPEAVLRKGKETKAYSLLNYLDTWTHRAKGYPVKIGKVGHMAKLTQSLFFRSLVVRPRLPLRNLFQGVLTGVTVPDKRILNLRWWGKFKKLPQDVQEMALTQIDQRPAYIKDYMFLEETDKLKQGRLKILWKTAENAGRIYPLSDWWNRTTTFTRTYKRDTFFLNKYRRGELTEKQLYEKMAINKMDGLERQDMLKLFDEGKDVEAKFYHGKWMVDNSQWIYQRDQKSFFEMTGEGEWITNLFTWTKGITQQTIEVGMRFQEAMERGNKKAILSSTTQLMGLLFMGQVANYTLQHLTFRHGSRYSDYGIDMFIWEVGGVTIDIMKETVAVTAGLLTSIDGTPDERKKAQGNFLKFLDNTGIRQLLPFTKTALSVYEAAVGRSYASPIFNAMTKKGMDKVDRTLVERLSHALWATDPSKSKQTYVWTTEQREKYHQNYLNAKNPVSREKNRLLFMRYKYLSDLFARYQPIEIYGYYERGERDKIMMEFEPDYWLKKQATEERKLTQEARRLQHGYF